MKDRTWVEKLATKVGQEVKELGQNLVRGGLDEFWNGAGPQGAHEAAAALFNGNAFVMYPRGKHDDGHGVHGQEQEGQQHAQGGPELHREEQEKGREM